MGKPLQKLLSLPVAELLQLPVTTLLLPYYRFRLNRHGLQFFSILVRASQGLSAMAVPDAGYARACRVAVAVNGVAGHLPGEYSCLVRSLVLLRILSCRKISAELVIGGMKTEGQPDFAAHAWVECRGRAINDSDQNVSRFQRFPFPLEPWQ